MKIVSTTEGRIDPAVLLGIGAAAEDDLAARPSHHDDEEGHDHDDFDSFVLDVPAFDDPASFVDHLAGVAGRHGVLRMKGFLAVRNKPMRLLVQGVGGRFRQQFDRPWAAGEERRGRLVVIGEKGVDRGAVAAAIGAVTVHLLPSDNRSLDDEAAALDLEQSPAELVVLSFSDGDLAAVAAAHGTGQGLPTLRLANLSKLKHPFSVDLYVEKVAAKARFVLVRLLGGLDYWRYGIEELAAAARRHGFELAVIPGCEREDRRLDAASTLPGADLRRLWAWFREGGPDNLAQMLRFVGSRLGRDLPWSEPRAVPAAGLHSPFCRPHAAEAAACADRVLPLGAAGRRHGAGGRPLPMRCARGPCGCRPSTSPASRTRPPPMRLGAAAGHGPARRRSSTPRPFRRSATDAARCSTRPMSRCCRSYSPAYRTRPGRVPRAGSARPISP